MADKLVTTVIVIVLCMCCAPVGSASDQTWVRYDFGGFEISYPEDMKFTEQRVIDFFIGSFSIGGQPIMATYTGFHPSFENTVRGYEVAHIKLNGFEAQDSVRPGPVTGLISRDVLVCERAGPLLYPRLVSEPRRRESRLMRCDYLDYQRIGSR